jgi:hypothetical protein
MIFRSLKTIIKTYRYVSPKHVFIDRKDFYVRNSHETSFEPTYLEFDLQLDGVPKLRREGGGRLAVNKRGIRETQHLHGRLLH